MLNIHGAAERHVLTRDMKSFSKFVVVLAIMVGLVVFGASGFPSRLAEQFGLPVENGDQHTEKKVAEVNGQGHDPHHHSEDQGGHHAIHKIVATSPVAQDVTLTRQYVAQIHSRRHIDVRALEGGYLKSIQVNEGQPVKQGDTMFHILPTLYSARLEADLAEAQQAQVEYDNTKSLVDQNIVSPQEEKVAKANLAKALAKVKLARAEMNFADIKAPFDGIVDRLHEQEGSLIEEGAMLTTLSDNSVVWVYFNVPEARYLEYQKTQSTHPEQVQVELKLANHEIFGQQGKIGAIEADFDHETGNIAFRADFPNPNRLLRHGQTGTVLLHTVRPDAIVIPQRATYEILAKRYVYVIDDENIVHQREIDIADELDDVYVLESGIEPSDKIVLEGVLQVRDGQHVEFEFQDPNDVLSNLKLHAE